MQLTPVETKTLHLLVQRIAVVSYYLTLVLDMVGVTETDTQTLINGLLNVFNFIVALGAALLVDRLGICSSGLP